MDETAITRYITDAFPHVEITTNFGYTFFFYGADHMLPFATLSSSDNEHDRVSNLDRPGVYRLNIGISRATFQSLFGSAKVDVQNYDYTALDTIMPHPEYAAQSFICVLSPSAATFAQLQPLIAEAYQIAADRNMRRQGRE